MSAMGPQTRNVPPALRDQLAPLFTVRGHSLLTNPKNRYIAFEVRTDGRSIFTLYTSGKLVTTVRDGDGEGLLLDDELNTLLGGAAAPREARSPTPLTPGTAPLLAGLDETGTGEIIGSALIGGALLPRALESRVSAVAGHVETKSSRTTGGWERLGEELAGLRAEGLIISLLPVPNRLFDAWSKNGLLDLAYVRAVSNLFAAHGAATEGMHLAIDDYGAGPLLRGAARAWSGAGIDVALQTKADDRYLAARAASVYARAGRARELLGLESDIDDGPLGSGNPGHPATRAWLRRHARGGRPWPSFVKASFSTVRSMRGLEPVEKSRVPALDALLGDAGAAGLVSGRLPLDALALPVGSGAPLRGLTLDRRGRSAARCPAAPFLPLLFGGLVLDPLADDLDLLDDLLDREAGLASGWRVLLGPEPDVDHPATRSLLNAHRRGVIQLEPTRQADPVERAVAHGALLLGARDAGLFAATIAG